MGKKKLQNHSIIEVAILNISLFVFLFFPEWLTEKVKNQLQIYIKAFNNQIFRKKTRTWSIKWRVVFLRVFSFSPTSKPFGGGGGL